MAREIEAKMRLDDRTALEQRLAQLGAQQVAVILERNTYFDTESEALKAADQGLRLRIEERDDAPPQMIVTHKGPCAAGELKNRSETELPVGDEQAALDLLRALGYAPLLTFEKRRRRWMLDDCRVEIDTLPRLGDFVEIEGPTEDAIFAVRRRLDLAGAALIRTSYIALLREHLRDQRDSTATLRLDSSDASAWSTPPA